jgi:hypothetical protein
MMGPTRKGEMNLTKIGQIAFVAGLFGLAAITHFEGEPFLLLRISGLQHFQIKKMPHEFSPTRPAVPPYTSNTTLVI